MTSIADGDEDREPEDERNEGGTGPSDQGGGRQEGGDRGKASRATWALSEQGLGTPEEARALLEALPPDARALLAQVLAISLVRDDVAPVAVPPERVRAAVAPLAAAGLVHLPRDDSEACVPDRAARGAVPPGWIPVAACPRLVGLVLALISGAPQDFWRWRGSSGEDIGRLRRYPFG